MANELKAGSPIPPFFLKDHEGFDVRNDDLLGTPAVLFFYPKDGTPGCTDEACGFRDKMDRFDAMQTLIIGISPDTQESHKKFIKAHKLEYTLLSDEKKEMCRSYGVLDSENQVIRTTFVINSEGIIQWVEKPVKITGHIDRVLEAVEKFCKEEIINFDHFEKDYAEFLEGTLKPSKDQQKIHEQILKDFGLDKGDLGKKH